MQKTKLLRLLTRVLCLVLIAVAALCMGACDEKADTNKKEDASASQNEKKVLGAGKTVFDFIVTDTDGKETAFEIHTDKKTVGDALLEHKLIDGEQQSVGFMVTVVNGKELDWNKDGKYWAFYVNGEFASKGVDSTDVKAGAVYQFKAE